jgi:hypothetical protein
MPVARRRYEPLRKQSRFEGSFRQRRANTLRLVAAAERTLGELDAGRRPVPGSRTASSRIDAEVVSLPSGR